MSQCAPCLEHLTVTYVIVAVHTGSVMSSFWVLREFSMERQLTYVRKEKKRKDKLIPSQKRKRSSYG